MNHYVEPVWLKDHLADENIKVIDCTFNLSKPEWGREEYTKSHIPGAVYFDLEKDLSGLVLVHGGRHPLPDLKKLQGSLEEAGVDNRTILVAYDRKESAFASRFWWLMKYIGHEQVYILNGGLAAWREAGYEESSLVQEYIRTNYSVKENPDILATYEEVRDIAMNEKEGTVLIDSREEKRYLGEEEPIDRIAGHIPKAINKPWTDGFENGRFKPKEIQEERFSGINKEAPIVVYCGSGVTATPNYIALKEAGFKNVKLYAGSYSDWVSYEKNPVLKGRDES